MAKRNDDYVEIDEVELRRVLDSKDKTQKPPPLRFTDAVHSSKSDTMQIFICEYQDHNAKIVLANRTRSITTSIVLTVNELKALKRRIDEAISWGEEEIVEDGNKDLIITEEMFD